MFPARKESDMANKSLSTHIVCPYWYDCERDVIVCEGLLDGSSHVVNRFPGTAPRDAWVRSHCLDYAYRQCPIARANEMRWADKVTAPPRPAAGAAARRPYRPA